MFSILVSHGELGVRMRVPRAKEEKEEKQNATRVAGEGEKKEGKCLRQRIANVFLHELPIGNVAIGPAEIREAKGTP